MTCRAFAASSGFVCLALHRVDLAGGPAGFRGQPLATRDEATRTAIAALDGDEPNNVDCQRFRVAGALSNSRSTHASTRAAPSVAPPRSFEAHAAARPTIITDGSHARVKAKFACLELDAS